jgi:very-short-patch-repair endonuclease
MLSALALATDGVFRGQDARARGVSDRALQHQVSTGWAIRIRRDIYRLRDHPYTWRSQLRAALFDAGPQAVIALRSAARLLGFWRYRAAAFIEVTGPWAANHDVTLGRFHRSLALPASHITLVDGFPVTTPARTCFDLSGDPDPAFRRSDAGMGIHERNMARVVNDALARRGMTLGQLAAVRAAIGGRGRSGSALMRRLFLELGPDYVPTTSEGESLVAEVIEELGLLEPERQVPMSDHTGWIMNVDFLWPDHMFILEVDSIWHDGPLDRKMDREQQRRLEAMGYEVWRWPYKRLVVHTAKFGRLLSERLQLGTAIDAMASIGVPSS